MPAYQPTKLQKITIPHTINTPKSRPKLHGSFNLKQFMDVGDWMVGWYENEQKVGRRDVRDKALSWDDEWDKAKK